MLAILLADDDDELQAALVYADGMGWDDEQLLDAVEGASFGQHERLLDALEQDALERFGRL